VKIPSWTKFVRGASLQRDFDEARQLLGRYVKEQTLAPLKNLGRYVLWGVVGSLFVGFGTLMLLVGGLRFLQDVFPVFRGSLSWIPYLIVVVVGVVVIALVARRAVAGVPKRRPRTP
jgi:membrane protein YqaA with SNARE-associated domain